MKIAIDYLAILYMRRLSQSSLLIHLTLISLSCVSKSPKQISESHCSYLSFADSGNLIAYIIQIICKLIFNAVFSSILAEYKINFYSLVF